MQVRVAPVQNETRQWVPETGPPPSAVHEHA